MKKSTPIKYRNGRVVKVGDQVFAVINNEHVTGRVTCLTKTGCLLIESGVYAAFPNNCIHVDDAIPTIRGS